jgi:hypothetical protein
LRVLPLLRLPALSLLPGHIPAHDARWPAVGKRVMSTPISATSTSTVHGPTPGIGSPPRRSGEPHLEWPRPHAQP